MTIPFNELDPAEAERLAFLAEECGELVQAIGKILRHGYFSINPVDPHGKSNRANLIKEMGDVRAAMILMCLAGDVRKDEIHAAANEKLISVVRWMHEQPAGYHFPGSP